MVPIGTSHLWWLRVRTHLSSASVHLSLLVGARSGIVEVFCLRIIRVNALGQMVQSLLRKGASDLAPLSSRGYYRRFVFIRKYLGSLHGSAGLQAGHGSGSEFFSTVLDSASAFSARLAHSGVLPRVDFFSLRTFLWWCNSLGIVVDWEMSQLVAHQ